MAASGGGDDDVGGGPAPEVPAPRVYNYRSRSNISAINWSVRQDKWYRVAIGSMIPTYRNQVDILHFDEIQGQNRPLPLLSFVHPHAPSKVMFLPGVHSNLPDLLATSSDTLRIWRLSNDSLTVDIWRNLSYYIATHPPHLTSFDWNEIELSRIVTSSIDMTCRIWDIEDGTIRQPVLTHTSAINDISWGGAENFVSGSADGTIHLFDLRCRSHTNVLYPISGPTCRPIVRVEWNKLEPRYIAAAIRGSSNVVAFDVRFPTYSVFELRHHQASVNAIAWSPLDRSIICTCSDDGHVHMWDVSWVTQRDGNEPAGSSAAAEDANPEVIMSYNPGFAIKRLNWSKVRPQWLAISSLTNLQIVKF